MEKSHPKTVGIAQYGTLSIMPLLVCSKPLVEQIYQRIAKKYNEVYKGFNGKMLLLLKTSTDFRMMGLIGENIYLISSYWKCGFDYLEDNNIYSQDSDMTARAGVIKELKRLQAGQLPGFTRDDIGELIKDVCCF